MADPHPTPPSTIDRLAAKARRVILFERAWPAAVFVASVAAVFVAASWLGLWDVVPAAGRIAGVLACAAALVGGAAWLLRDLSVTRPEALRRLDRDSGLPHRPISAFEDRLANDTDDPLTQALWARSRQQVEGVARSLRLAPPSPRLVERDPYGLRMVALLGLVAAGFVAGSDKVGLLGAAFSWQGRGVATPASRVDIWIDPPPYTGRPPFVLSSMDGKPPPDMHVTVPAHATAVVRASGGDTPEIVSHGGVKPMPAPTVPGAAAPEPAGGVPAAARPAGAGERRFAVEADGTLLVRQNGRTIGPLVITALPDRPPTITLTAPPTPTARGGLTVGYRIADDYGVTGAEAAFAEPAPPDEGTMVRSLVPPPRLPLTLPAAPGGLGSGQTAGDLSDHPWAGSEVTMTLTARDEGGNTGSSAPVRITLPARPFHNPLARALVEQRRDLVFDPDHRAPVGLALDALMVDPDLFGTPNAVYLGLYTARQRLDSARSDADLVALSDFLWQMALKVEDGDAGQAARDLRAAEQALREALQRNAAPEEIKRLTAELQRQMEKFLAELQNRAAPKEAQRQGDAKPVSSQQLQAMMKQMQDMAEKGDAAGAQRMLDQLQAMLDNLRTARRDSPANQAMREMNRQMGELGRMTREQQALRDQTFRKGRSGRDAESPDEPGDDPADAAPSGQDGEAGQDAGQQPDAADLQRQQQALRQRLEAMQKSLRENGLQAEQGLGDAEGAMKDAEGALGRGKPGNRSAVEAQGRALQGLQKGAAGMAQQMAQGQSEEDGEGQGGGGQSAQGRNGENGDDPLGRPRNGRGTLEATGNPLDEGVAARAQRVLQELRQRLSNPNRPSEELDYLERLLRSE